MGEGMSLEYRQLAAFSEALAARVAKALDGATCRVGSLNFPR
jgi:hypothetical protein